MLMPHSIIHRNACFAYFNKIWGHPLRSRSFRISESRINHSRINQSLYEPNSDLPRSEARSLKTAGFCGRLRHHSAPVLAPYTRDHNRFMLF